MPARVQIVVEAKDAAGGVFRAFTSQLGSFGGLVEELTAKNVNWGNVSQQATQMVVDGLKESINATTQYAREVRDLSLASGQSAEQSSRMLQVLDDYQLTAEDARTATRALTREGLAPTMETIAELSGEYQRLTSAEDKNAFATKYLGRASQEWLNLLDQGPGKIRNLNASVSEGLILTEKNVQQAEEYRLAMDEWSDAVQQLKISIGTGLIPVLTDMITVTGKWSSAAKTVDRDYGDLIPRERNMMIALQMEADAWNQNIAALQEAHANIYQIKDDYAQTSNVIQTEVEKEKAAIEATKQAQDEFNSSMSELKTIIAGDLGKAQDDYNTKIAEYKQKLIEARTEKEKDQINANIAAETAAYNKRAVAIAFNIQQEAILNSTLPPEQKIGMITALGQAYGMYDQATANAINTTQEWLTRVEKGTLSEEAAVQWMKGMAQGMKETGKAASETGGEITVLTSQTYHTGERAKDAIDSFAHMAKGAEGLGNSINSSATPAVAGLKSNINQLQDKTVNIDVNIRTHGRMPGAMPWEHPGCFVAGTLVTMADGTRKPIEFVRAGDRVLSWHEGKFVEAEVTEVFHHSPDDAPVLIVINGKLTATPEHLIYVNDGWVAAGKLVIGDMLLSEQVVSIERLPGSEPVYNLHTSHEAHNYFANGILVHNGKQLGGEVFAGVPTWVGEAGREPFIPGVNGRILGHAESLHQLSLGGGGGQRNVFYGPVTLQISDEGAGGIMGVR